MTQPKPIRAGDEVFHHPSGETWIVATDESAGHFYACGWPETRASVEDIEIVKMADDAKNLRTLQQAASSGGGRGAVAKFQATQKMCHRALRGMGAEPTEEQVLRLTMFMLEETPSIIQQAFDKALE